MPQDGQVSWDPTPSDHGGSFSSGKPQTGQVDTLPLGGFDSSCPAMAQGATRRARGEAFAAFVRRNEIGEFYLTGADAVACVKSTVFNMRAANHTVHVLSDCITSYDTSKIDEMLRYYESKGCEIITLDKL